MRILIVGLGAIGSTFGYLFHSAGNQVEHLIRPTSASVGITQLSVNLLDARNDPKGKAIEDTYPIIQAKAGTIYDLIFLSIPEAELKQAIQLLDENALRGPLLIACSIWEDHAHVDQTMRGHEYVLGFPIAGANKAGNTLNCCILSRFMLDGSNRTNIKNYDAVMQLFHQCNIGVECPYDMLQWLWINMATSAAIITKAGSDAITADPSSAITTLLNSDKLLSQTIIMIRECIKIIETRGINTSHYKNELLPYKLPSKLAGIVMKRMYSDTQAARKVMSLYNNVDDLLLTCKNVYDWGKSHEVQAPQFYQAYEQDMTKTIPK